MAIIYPKNYEHKVKTSEEVTAEETGKTQKKTNVKPEIKTFINSFNRGVEYAEIWKYINTKYPSVYTQDEVNEIILMIEDDWKDERPKSNRGIPRGK